MRNVFKTELEMTRLEQLFRYLGDAPNDPFLLFAIAKEYEGQQDLTQALAYYTKLTAEHVDYVGTYYHLGKLYEKLNDIDAAIATYDAGMRIAQAQGERHAHGELSTARMLIADDDF